jgi:outer membrane lipoprotein-sorting protein
MLHVMTRRSLIALIARALPALALPAAALSPGRAAAQARPAALTAADRADLARIETYLDGLKTLKARFLQVSGDGRTAGGTAWLDRPGKMRFQYDTKDPLLLVAGGGLVVFYDGELKQTSNLLLTQTPLGILLADHVRMSGDVTVTNIARVPGQIQVTLVRSSTPGDGSLTLIFADNPLALRQWSVLDAQGKETRVSLFDIQLGGTFDPKLFYFVDPALLGPSGGSNILRAN